MWNALLTFFFGETTEAAAANNRPPVQLTTTQPQRPPVQPRQALNSAIDEDLQLAIEISRQENIDAQQRSIAKVMLDLKSFCETLALTPPIINALIKHYPAFDQACVGSGDAIKRTNFRALMSAFDNIDETQQALIQLYFNENLKVITEGEVESWVNIYDIFLHLSGEPETVLAGILAKIQAQEEEDAELRQALDASMQSTSFPEPKVDVKEITSPKEKAVEEKGGNELVHADKPIVRPTPDIIRRLRNINFDLEKLVGQTNLSPAIDVLQQYVKWDDSDPVVRQMELLAKKEKLIDAFRNSNTAHTVEDLKSFLSSYAP